VFETFWGGPFVNQEIRGFVFLIQFVMRHLAMALFALLAMILVSWCLLATFGAMPWLELAVWWNGVPVANAGIYAQVGFAILSLALCFFLPTNQRILALENSHRKFSIGIQDVARAYYVSHAADRAGIFKISSEFEAVRERLAYLRNHPDLSHLEPEALEIAAEMSYISKELAVVYADDKVERAREFLKQRQEEVDLFNERLERAKTISQELKHWQQEVELEEAVAAAQLERLRDELNSILPEVGAELIVDADAAMLELPKAAE